MTEQEDLIKRNLAIAYAKSGLIRQIDGEDWIRISEVVQSLKDIPIVEPKLKDDIIETFNQITDQEFEHSDSFWIITPKGKKIEFEKKRPQGEWIGKDRDSRGYCGCFECSNCGAYIYPHCLEKELDYNGCPYCFADMRGEKK